MSLPFTKDQVSTTEKAVNYAQTSSDEDFIAFKDWFVPGSNIWIMPPGYKDAVLAAIATRIAG
jgi:hypothetical protein